jgi:ketosteroid isomerase-like protein
MAEMLPGLEHALEAMNRGDVDEVAALLDPDVDWRARPHGHLWWKQAPHCHGRDDARENLRRQAAKVFRLELVEEVGDRLVVAGRWSRANAADDAGEFVQVMTVRNERIVDIQGFSSRRAARRYAHRGG